MSRICLKILMENKVWGAQVKEVWQNVGNW